jgi:hypothetical protein
MGIICDSPGIALNSIFAYKILFTLTLNYSTSLYGCERILSVQGFIFAEIR